MLKNLLLGAALVMVIALVSLAAWFIPDGRRSLG